MEGARELLLRAITSQNFGCTHMVAGCDEYADVDALPEVGIEIVRWPEVYYCTTTQGYTDDGADIGAIRRVRGAEARAAFEQRELPPPWLMRPEISRIVLDAMHRGEPVLVRSSTA